MNLRFGLVFVFAATAGSTVGSLGALVRARWVQIVKSKKQLDTAFSWASVVDEILFVTGPAGAMALATPV